MSLSNTSKHRLIILHTNNNVADVRELIMDGASLDKHIFLAALRVTIVEIGAKEVFLIPAGDTLFSVYPSDRPETCVYALNLLQYPNLNSDSVCIEIDDEQIQYQSSQAVQRASFGARPTVGWVDPLMGFFFNYWIFHNESTVELLIKYQPCKSVVTTTSYSADFRPIAQAGLQVSVSSVITTNDELDSIQKFIGPGISDRCNTIRLPVKCFVELQNGTPVGEDFVIWGGTSVRVTDEEVVSARNRTTISPIARVEGSTSQGTVNH